MLDFRPKTYHFTSGFSMIEVLITIFILAFGLLGQAGLQLKMQVAEMESYQRGQALILLNDMSERMKANSAAADSYVTAAAASGPAGGTATGLIGTGDAQPASCSALTAGSAARDICEWSNLLKGSSEVMNPGTSASTNVGAMIGARGCITQTQAPDSTTGVCQPGIYEVSVAWQGRTRTVASAMTCGQGSFGTDDYRRVVSTSITVGLPGCF